MRPVTLQNNIIWQRTFFTSLLCLALSACGGGGNNSNEVKSSGAKYTIDVTVFGLVDGSKLILQNKGIDDLTVAKNGVATFSTPIAANGNYDVTVLSVTAGQVCSVYNGTGAGVMANITNVSVVCSTVSLSVGGDVSGLLSGETLVLVDKASGNTVAIIGDGANKKFTFLNKIPYNGAHNIQVQTSSANRTCSIVNGVGSKVTDDVTNINVVCSGTAYQVGGTVTGLMTGQQLTLYNNGGDPVTVSTNTPFIFPTKIAYGAAYRITVNQQPTLQSCAIARASGTVIAPVSNIAVTCSQTAFTVGGTVTGLTNGNVVLLNNGNAADAQVVNSSGDFVFDQALTIGQNYNITVSANPPKQKCSVSNGIGTLGSANVTVTCVAKSGDINTYITNQTDGTVSMYAMVVSSPLIPFAKVLRSKPRSIVLHPNGEYVYIVNYGDNSLAALKINASTGALSDSISPNVTPVGNTPTSIAIHPYGTFAYVTNFADDRVSMYSINSTTGGLTAFTASSSTISAGDGPFAIAVHPNGKYAYVVNNLESHVWMYNIDLTTGALAQFAVPAINTGSSGARAIALHPNGKHAYVVNYSGNNISMFNIDINTGVLTPNGSPYTISAKTAPVAMLVHPNGKYAYVINQGTNNISLYNIDSASGLLVAFAEPNATVDTNGAPAGIAFVENSYSVGGDVFSGVLLVTNSGSNNVTQYRVIETSPSLPPGALIKGSSFDTGSAPDGIVVNRR